MKKLFKVNGLTKTPCFYNQTINGIVFKPSKQNKPKRLNALSFRSFWFGYTFRLGFWLCRKSLHTNLLDTILTNLTKIYSKTNKEYIREKHVKKHSPCPHVCRPL